MTFRPPWTTHAHWPEGIPSGRFASTISCDDPTGCSVAILGLPDDTGIGLNHGRIGAAEGPAMFRMALSMYGARAPGGMNLPRVFDAGDLEPAADLDQTHERVTQAAKALHKAGLFPIAIGGGHDLTFPFVRAAANTHGSLAGLYFDAHFDVRAEKGSGMPFRALIDGGHAHELHVLGLDRFANSAEHREWFTQHCGHIDDLTLETPMEFWPTGDLFASFDLDVIDQAHAPGVSAINPNGWSPSLAAAWCHAVGTCPRIRCFDLMELSPPHDHEQRTARLAAHLFLSFLAGFSERKS